MTKFLIFHKDFINLSLFVLQKTLLNTAIVTTYQQLVAERINNYVSL